MGAPDLINSGRAPAPGVRRWPIEDTARPSLCLSERVVWAALEVVLPGGCAAKAGASRETASRLRRERRPAGKQGKRNRSVLCVVAAYIVGKRQGLGAARQLRRKRRDVMLGAMAKRHLSAGRQAAQRDVL